MKNRFLLVIILLFLVSCSSDNKDYYLEEETEVWPEVNVDSLFFDVDKSIIEKKEADLDNFFSRLHKRIGINGTVLIAENGRVVFE